jgi:hypothetical protein
MPGIQEPLPKHLQYQADLEHHENLLQLAEL